MKRVGRWLNTGLFCNVNIYSVNKVFLVFVITFSFSCKKENRKDLIKSTGEEIEETRILPAFTTVELNNRICLVLVKDTVYKAIVNGGKNIVPLIETSIENNVLYIRNNNKYNFMRSYKRKVIVELHYKNLNEIFLTGSGTLTANTTLTQDSLEIEARNASGDITLTMALNSLRIIQHTGPANFYLSGNVTNAYHYSGGQGIIHAENMQTTNTAVNNNGTGDFYVNATNVLSAELYAQGNVYYTQTPLIIQKKELGKGRLLKQ